MPDIFQIDQRDLIHLQTWYKKKPRQFAYAARQVINTLAEETRTQAIGNIQDGTTTRNKNFVKNSVRFNRAKGNVIDQLESTTYSVDLSRKGRSSGFEELEHGIKSKSKRVPTLAARGGTQAKQVNRAVRFNKSSNMISASRFRGGNIKTKHAALLRHIRAKKDKTPFIVERGIYGKMKGLRAGIWRLRAGGKVKLMNPFKGERDKTRAIHWMKNAVQKTTQQRNVSAIWARQINKMLR